MRLEDIKNAKEVLWALLVQLEKNGQQAIINNAIIERATRQGKNMCPFGIRLNTGTITVYPIYPEQILKLTPENQFAELWSEADEKRMDIIGTNGGTGEHYER